RSLEADTGVGYKAIHVAGEAWNAVIDRYPRVASFLHEARREGFNTPAKLHTLLNDERLSPKLTEISRRANKEAVDYGNLTPLEAGQAVTGLFQARSPHASGLAQELGPAASALYTLLSGKTSLGYDLPAGTSRAAGAAQGLVGDVPVLRVLGIGRGASTASA